MNRYILIIVYLLNFSLGSIISWSSTPIDKFINHNFNKMIFREPVYLIPYDYTIDVISTSCSWGLRQFEVEPGINVNIFNMERILMLL